LQNIVSFIGLFYKRDIQKRHIILKSLLLVATPHHLNLNKPPHITSTSTSHPTSPQPQHNMPAIGEAEQEKGGGGRRRGVEGMRG